ncbi:MAG: DUF3467 domain-containing protein [Candidatus Kerfeldbacteria bacterium]|nr:DUF3467 domain-containing protein [Candidatus Kerfeldbacteria bacterium]
MTNGQPRQLNIKADDQTLKGVYANSMMVAHSAEEFVLDFVNVLPPQAQLVSRVITSPGHLKRLIAALTENLKKYEAAHGQVEAASEPDREIGFRPTG